MEWWGVEPDGCSARLDGRSRLGGRFPVSVTAHVLCISSCLVSRMCKYHCKGDNAD